MAAALAGHNPRVFLIHGTDQVRIRQERTRLVGQFLPAEYRAENFAELEPPLGRTLPLNQVLGDLITELATPSFFPDIPRVVVVEQLAELLTGAGGGSIPRSRTAKKSGGKAEAMFCRFLERDMGQSSNVLILTVVEEPDKRLRIRTESPIYKIIQSIGRISQFSQSPVIFRFLDAFAARDLGTALASLSEILAGDDGAALVFRMLARHVRFLVQAKLLERAGESKADAEQFAARYFPPEKGLNLTQEHRFSVEKIRRAASLWSLAELNALLAQLESLSKIVYPSINDLYVPDLQVRLEALVTLACAPKVLVQHTGSFARPG